MAGLDTTGFTSKTLDEIKTEIETALKAEFGLINTNPDSVFGQMIIALAPSIYDVWERLEELFYSQYPASADGFALDNVCALTGIYRLAAVKSTVIGALQGTEGTVVPAGTQVSVNDTGDIFETTAAREITIERIVKITLTPTALLDVSLDINGVTYATTLGGTPARADTIDALIVALAGIIGVDDGDIAVVDGGDYVTINVVGYEDDLLIENLVNLTTSDWYSSASFQALETGAIEVALESLTEIETPVSGLTACTNYVAETTGRDVETDSELRIRRAASLSIVGAATVPAIQARILAEVDGGTACLVIENDTMVVDGDGRPAKSFECVVEGGTDLDVAEKIWELKPAGIATYGTVNGGAGIGIIDIDGNAQTIYFSRPTAKEIYVVVEFERNLEEDFPVGGEDAIKAAIKAMGDLQEIDGDVIYQKYYTPIYSIEGVANVTKLWMKIGGAPAITDVINIPIAANEIATFALVNISVTDVT